jgi:hypothetical protein
MTDQATSPLRRRMIEDMTVRKLVEETQKDYIRHVKELAIFLGRTRTRIIDFFMGKRRSFVVRYRIGSRPHGSSSVSQ